jgi:hypothetical protein
MPALWVTLGLMAFVFAAAFIAIDLFSDSLRQKTPRYVETERRGTVDIHTGTLHREPPFSR